MSCPRPFGPTDLQERARIVWMWVCGIPVRTIARDTRISVTTVYRWIRRWRKEGHVNTKPRSGRPRLASLRNKASAQHVLEKDKNFTSVLDDLPRPFACWWDDRAPAKYLERDVHWSLQHHDTLSAFKKYQSRNQEKNEHLEQRSNLWYSYEGRENKEAKRINDNLQRYRFRIMERHPQDQCVYTI